MRKRFVRIIALVMVMVSVMCIAPTTASAASAVSSITLTCGKTTGGETKYIYARTGSSKNSKKITVSTGAGSMTKTNDFFSFVYAKGSYEITIWYWNASSKKWIQEGKKYDIYNPQKDTTITFNRANTYYKVKIYTWNVNTTFKSYWNKNVTVKNPSQRSIKIQKYSGFNKNITVYWCTSPTFIAKTSGGNKLYTTTPTSVA